MEAVPVEPPVILPLTRREAVLLLYLMDLTTDVELVHVRYKLHCKLSTVALTTPPNINQQPTTNS